MSRGQGDTILVVSHEKRERDLLAGALRAAGAGVRVSSGADEAIRKCAEDPPAVVVTERALPGRDGFALTRLLRERHPDLVVVVACDRPSVDDTVALMREGAFHVLTRPLDPQEVAVVAQKALEQARLSRGNRELKTRLDVSEKLAMIGRLASGVAHELNNPLDGVRRYVAMTREALESDSRELNEYLDQAMSGLSRMAGIVRQLLTFSRNVVLENEAENLRTMLEEVVRTLSPTGSATALVELENPYVDIQMPRVLFQVYVNLLRNALDAVEPKGARGRVRVAVERAGSRVEVRVTDNGPGIPEKDLPRVFEPFFTTKEVGKGTGLGLPISARIVERCGGTLDIESQEGAGTTVVVSLPLDAVPASVASVFRKVQA